MAWTRTCALDAPPDDRVKEIWEYRQAGRSLTCEMDVTVGKPFDVLGLKGADLAETRDYAAFLKQCAGRLYGDDAPLTPVGFCPACNAPVANAGEALTVFGVAYRRCPVCGHGFVGVQPSPAALSDLFENSEEHSGAYIDHASVERRLEQIVRPKVDWTLNAYDACYGRRPANLLDVGAGGGHFVAGAQRAGVAARGVEKSRASRAFARDAFGIELSGADFLTEPQDPVDVITFWGLLEYVQQPRPFLEAARRRLTPESGLLVVEAPRFNAFGTNVQRVASDTVARHMDPTSHVNAFTDASLATAMVECGFRPVAAWYFGMDVYELLMQAALRLDDPMLPERLANFIPDLQNSLDQGRQCDDLVLAATPF